jgi:hypothetical protein
LNKSLTKIKNELNKLPEIRLAKTLKKRKTGPRKFLESFFKDYNENRETLLVDTKEVDTEVKKRRSFDDIYRIMHYYYPDMPISELVYYLYVDFPSNLAGFRTSHCYTIKKRVFYIGRHAGVYNTGMVDQHGNRWSEYQAVAKAPKDIEE